MEKPCFTQDILKRLQKFMKQDIMKSTSGKEVSIASSEEQPK